MEIDWNKPVQTRYGTPVRIICQTGNDLNYPIVGYIGTNFHTSKWTNTGKWSRCTTSLGNNLMNVPPKKEIKWINIYPGLVVGMHISREFADNHAGLDRVACIKIEYFEGEGIS